MAISLEVLSTALCVNRFECSFLPKMIVNKDVSFFSDRGKPATGPSPCNGLGGDLNFNLRKKRAAAALAGTAESRNYQMWRRGVPDYKTMDKTDWFIQKMRSIAECPGWIVPWRAPGGRRP